MWREWPTATRPVQVPGKMCLSPRLLSPRLPVAVALARNCPIWHTLQFLQLAADCAAVPVPIRNVPCSLQPDLKGSP